MKNIKAFVLAACVAAPAFVNAGLISDYTLDESTNIVTNAAKGQQWLQWTETRGMSINEALAANEGWSLASNEDVVSLYSDFFSNVTWVEDEHSTQSNNGYNVAGDGVDRSFELGELFGWTSYEDSFDFRNGVINPNVLDTYNTAAVFGTDSDGDGLYQNLFARSEVYYTSGKEPLAEGAGLYAERDYLSANYAHPAPIIGVALVREAQTLEVSEPGALALLGLGLFGLVYARKKQA